MTDQNQNQDKEIILSLSKKNGDFIVTCSSSPGPGGQNVNRRATKVRISHPASGAIGQSHTHKTQGQNKKEAFRRLVSDQIFRTWLRTELARQGTQTVIERKEGPTGGRGEKIRTYNFPRDEIINHRTGLKVKGIKDILDGKIDLILENPEKENDCKPTI